MDSQALGLALQNNGSNNFTVSAGGSFTFAGPVLSGSPWP
jgi:hypothetical protein